MENHKNSSTSSGKRSVINQANQTGDETDADLSPSWTNDVMRCQVYHTPTRESETMWLKQIYDVISASSSN